MAARFSFKALVSGAAAFAMALSTSVGQHATAQSGTVITPEILAYQPQAAALLGLDANQPGMVDKAEDLYGPLIEDAVTKLRAFGIWAPNKDNAGVVVDQLQEKTPHEVLVDRMVMLMLIQRMSSLAPDAGTWTPEETNLSMLLTQRYATTTDTMVTAVNKRFKAAVADPCKYDDSQSACDAGGTYAMLLQTPAITWKAAQKIVRRAQKDATAKINIDESTYAEVMALAFLLGRSGADAATDAWLDDFSVSDLAAYRSAATIALDAFEPDETVQAYFAAVIAADDPSTVPIPPELGKRSMVELALGAAAATESVFKTTKIIPGDATTIEGVKGILGKASMGFSRISKGITFASMFEKLAPLELADTATLLGAYSGLATVIAGTIQIADGIMLLAYADGNPATIAMGVGDLASGALKDVSGTLAISTIFAGSAEDEGVAAAAANTEEQGAAMFSVAEGGADVAMSEAAVAEISATTLAAPFAIIAVALDIGIKELSRVLDNKDAEDTVSQAIKDLKNQVPPFPPPASGDITGQVASLMFVR
ncbi:MAG: hypothetical protein AAGK00_13200 [Pseudomonadota bacterium]